MDKVLLIAAAESGRQNQEELKARLK